MTKRNLFQLLLGWLCMWLGVIAGLWLTPQPKLATGIPHPQYDPMLHSGDSVATLAHTQWLAYFFGIGIIGIFLLGLFIGAWKNHPETRKNIYRWFAWGSGLYFLAFTAMIVAYGYDVAHPEDLYVLGFPLPTALMLFVFGFSPLYFSVLYIINFPRWILTPAEEQAFQNLVQQRRQREAASPPN